MTLSKEQTEHIAHLARLELTESELQKFSSELSAILEFVKKLEKVNTKNVEPIANIAGLKNVVREDEAKKCEIPREKMLENAPDKKDGFLKVKGVFDES